MAASSSSFTAANPNINSLYDVFIDHRGVDVMKTFARFLYLRLLFVDQKELQQGYNFPRQIKHDIRTASVHVAIFSPQYAESNWCLHELLLMLESKAPIILVFNPINSPEVRWTQSKVRNYAQALQNLATKKTWRKAISLVSDLSGFELEECGFELEDCNGEELELELWMRS